ncbi:MAG: efflux transporter outer membrane subunit [Cardiobacteriaceae bacterium]|nr:efflux transporter outer membrane subunit [Cardiobacteriaceae bacterium]
MKNLLLKPIPFALILAGCSLVPKYEQPNVALPQNWMDVAIHEQSQAPTADQLGWREYFRDPRLQKLIEEALAYNHDLKKAALNIEIAEAQYGIQKTERLPSVNANGSVTRSRTATDLTGTGHYRIGDVYNIGVASAAFELDFYGRVKSMSEQVLNQYLGTEEAHDAAVLSIISAVAKTYYQARIAQAQMALADDVLHTRQETYRLSKLQYDAGLMTAIDLRGVETQIESARSSYAEAKRSHQQALNALSKLLGKPIGDIQLPPAGDLNSQFAQLGLPAGIPSNALLHRPDIREAEYQLKAANANIGAARAALYPSISLTGNIGFGSTELDQLIKAPNLGWTFSPSIVLPIFDRAKLNRNVDIAESQQKLAVENYQSIVQSAFYEVADALAARETLAEQYAAQLRGNKAVSDRLRLENLRFESGVSTALDRLDAQRESYSSDQALLATELQILANNVDLYITMGGGLHEYGVSVAALDKEKSTHHSSKSKQKQK